MSFRASLNSLAEMELNDAIDYYEQGSRAGCRFPGHCRTRGHRSLPLQSHLPRQERRDSHLGGRPPAATSTLLVGSKLSREPPATGRHQATLRGRPVESGRSFAPTFPTLLLEGPLATEDLGGGSPSQGNPVAAGQVEAPLKAPPCLPGVNLDPTPTPAAAGRECARPAPRPRDRPLRAKSREREATE